MAVRERHILSLSLEPRIKTKLVNSGFCFVEDFDGLLTPELLKKKTTLSESETNEVILEIQRQLKRQKDNEKISSFQPVSQLLKQELKEGGQQHIITLSKHLDDILGGGIKLCELTEIAGEAGLGKTQLCFQLCVDVQIPISLGGMQAEAVFLDVEGTFVPQRVKQIAVAAIEHCKYIAEVNNVKCDDLTAESFMSSIYLFRCHDSVQLLAAMAQMNNFLNQHKKVKLLILDSMACSVRSADDMKSRNKVISNLSTMLREIAANYNVAVVYTNQVTSRPNCYDGQIHTVPSLGESFSHLASTKLLLALQNNQRYALLYKSPSHKSASAMYQVTPSGIRDYVAPISS